MTNFTLLYLVVYVGLYGFSFMEAGQNVMTMFRNRGWTTIITDSMVDTVLFMVAAGVGGITSLLTVMILAIVSVGSMSGGTYIMAAVLGFFIGYSMSSTFFSVVSSAVNTVIVCYAEAPNEFQANHPDLSNRMREAWRLAYPDDFNY
jgi:Plasma-membrane choline transporter